MYIDSQLLFSDAQAVTSTAASTNSVNFGFDGNIGIGEPMAVVVVVDVALDAADGNETYVISLEADDNDAFSSAATIASYTATRGDAAGTKYVLHVPADTSAEKYLRVKYTHGGTSPTGTYTAFLIPLSMVQNNVVYPDGFTIS